MLFGYDPRYSRHASHRNSTSEPNWNAEARVATATDRSSALFGIYIPLIGLLGLTMVLAPFLPRLAYG